MKILLLCQYYDAYLRSFYTHYPDVASLPYKQQLNRILDDYFGWPPALIRRVGERGHGVEIIIANAESLQRAWARENSIEFNRSDWQFSLPYAQVGHFRPDVVWMVLPFKHYGLYSKELKQFCRRTFAWIAAPFPSQLDLSSVDCVLTSHPNFVQAFRQGGIACKQLLPAFEPRINERLGQEKPGIAVSFVGGLSPVHTRRKQVLEAIAHRVPLQVWGYGIPAPYPVTGVRTLWRRIWYYRHSSPLADCYRGEAWGMDMYRVLQRSRTTVNVHIDAADGLAGNMRMFEATGVGTLLFTEEAPNLEELFRPNAELAAYCGFEDLVEKIEYYLENDQARQSLATAGQRRTLT
ncbi:MAG: glycosyltransferase, partial [Chloroflexota bacterium]